MGHSASGNLVNGLAHQESLVAQWLERPTGILESMGSITVGNSVFSFSLIYLPSLKFTISHYLLNNEILIVKLASRALVTSEKDICLRLGILYVL